MANFVATATEEKWPYDVLVRNTVCQVCNNQYYNCWYSCNRRAAATNSHPGLLSLTRQHVYMVKLLVKYQTNKFGILVPFHGHPGATTEMEEYVVVDQSVPKSQQRRKYIRHGNITYIFYIIIIYF